MALGRGSAFLTVCALGVLGLCLLETSSVEERLYSSGSASLLEPKDPTLAQVAEFNRMFWDELSFPAGWVFTEIQGFLDVRLVGPIGFDGRRQLVATVLDEARDLEAAMLFIDGKAVFRASRENGSIVETGANAKATLSTRVFPRDVNVKVEWTARDGTVQSGEAACKPGRMMLASLWTCIRRQFTWLLPQPGTALSARPGP